MGSLLLVVGCYTEGTQSTTIWPDNMTSRTITHCMLLLLYNSVCGDRGGGYHAEHGYHEPHKKCHYEYDTVYETVYHTVYKKACTSHYNKKCHVEYEHSYETKYHPKCHTSYHPVCKVHYLTKYKDDCHTQYHKSCKKSYTVKYEHEVKKKCHVYHEESCHGYGYHKKCHVHPREECHDIPIKHPVKVPLGKFIDKVITLPQLRVVILLC